MQAWPAAAQGGWHEQPVAPAVQLTTLPFPPGCTQLRPVQHAVPPTLHALLWATHVTGGVQTPAVQESVGLQHGTLAEQV